MSKSKEIEISHQIDNIITNRQRRFNYLMRKNRIEDAIAIGDEFLEWMDPDNEFVVDWYSEIELANLYSNLTEEKKQKKKKRGRKNKND